MGGLKQALAFDFDAPPPEPDWVVDDIIERGTVTMFSADSGKGKSIVMADLVVAIIQGRRWLGRATHGERVVVIDGENSPRLVRSRLQAFGMTNADRDGLLYFNRTGVSLGEGDWFDRTEETLQNHQPDLLIIDTAAAATAAPVNDNDAVSALYKTVLRPLTYYCPVILLHHERKQAEGGAKVDRGQVMMGARQWFGQADAHFSLESPDDIEPWESEWQGDGTLLERHHIQLVRPKDRDRPTGGIVAAFAVTSLKEEDGLTRRWMKLEMADVRGSLPTRTAQEAWYAQVAAIIRDSGGSASPDMIADALGVSRSEPALLRGLTTMYNDGKLTQPASGLYELPPDQSSMEV